MRVIETVLEFKNWRKSVTEKKVGFVPTMGALHHGHETLLARSTSENDITVLSIFVNPTQFNDPNDFNKYPKTWDQDLEMACKNKVDVVFAPSFQLMYPDDFRYKVIETDFSKLLCGKDRPGHFDGVLTVVMKLFMLCQPTRAYFGEKDFQQLSLIRGMTEAFFLDLEIIPVTTVREQDGLAMSSRNTRLSKEQRQQAPKIYEALRKSHSDQEAAEALQKEGFVVDYVIDRKGRRFAAAKLGEVRLIDNVEI